MSDVEDDGAGGSAAVRDDRPLRRVFGDDPFIAIVDTLLDHPSAQYTKTDLAEVNDIARQTVYNVWDRIEDCDIVKPARKIGNTTLYTLNGDAPVAKAFWAFSYVLRHDGELPKQEGERGE
jgi:hypothetical protein